VDDLSEPVVDLARGPGDLGRAPLTPGEAAQRVAFPLFMIATLVAFLIVQGRFDRRDPKLLFDTNIDNETLSFE
jgi:hypothetical protein